MHVDQLYPLHRSGIFEAITRRDYTNACGSTTHPCTTMIYPRQSQAKKPLMQVDQTYPMHYDRQSMSNPKTIGSRLAEQNKRV